MNRQLSLVDLVRAIQDRVREGTPLPCYDQVPDGTTSPFVFCEVVSIEPADNKTMYVKDYTVWLHIIAEETPSSVPIYQYIQQVQEAMTEDIRLPSYVRLVLQTDAGLQTIQDDPSGEKHAVLEYRFKVAYGFKAKF